MRNGDVLVKQPIHVPYTGKPTNMEKNQEHINILSKSKLSQ